jgi:hypothetical protein
LGLIDKRYGAGGPDKLRKLTRAHIGLRGTPSDRLNRQHERITGRVGFADNFNSTARWHLNQWARHKGASNVWPVLRFEGIGAVK